MTTTTTGLDLDQRQLKRIATLARRIFFPQVESPDRRRTIDKRLLELLEAAAIELEAGDRDTLRRLAQGQSSHRPARSPPEIRKLLARTLGIAGLHLWAEKRHPRRLRALGERATLAAWLARPPFRPDEELLKAGIRYGVERTEVRSEDIDKRLGREFRKEGAMATTTTVDFKVDPRNFPDFDEQEFVDRVDDALPDTFEPGANKKAVFAAIVGILLVDGHSRSKDFALKRAVRTAIREAEDTTIDGTGDTVSNTDIYKRVVDVLSERADKVIYYEELVAAARSVFQNAGRLAFDEEGIIAAQIEKAAEEYATGGGVVGGLDLPELVTADDEDEVVSENVRAVSVIYAAYQLEQAKVFDVVDRILEIFMNGLLPVGFDPAGRALDDLYFSSEDRYDKSQRFMQFSRVLGAPGGDVSSEVAPNAEFERLLLRFLASVSEFERQLRLGDLFEANANSGRRSLAITGEHVRKAGRDLAANASLYGWANTHFAARRMSNHISTAMKILRLAEIQNAYGVQSPWQVIERVSSLEFGEAPNIVRYRTLADSGKKVLDLVANNATAWTSSTSGPLFDNVPCEATTTGGTTRSSRAGSRAASIAAITPCDRDELFRHTEAILAVMGIKDIQVDEYSEPAESVLAPSIPSMGGGPQPTPGGNGGGNGDLEAEIRRMIDTGKAPDIADLERLVRAGS